MKTTSRSATIMASAVLLCSLVACSPYFHYETIPDPCRDGDENCHAPSQKIRKAFLSGTGLYGLSLPALYCGTCFHEGEYIDPYYPHQGIVLIDQKNGRRYFDAVFSFYPETNTCDAANIDSIRKAMLGTLFAADHKINWNRDVAWVLLNPSVESDQIRYCIRRKRMDNDRLLLIGIWKGNDNRVFCNLKRVR